VFTECLLAKASNVRAFDFAVPNLRITSSSSSVRTESAFNTSLQ